MWIQNKSIEKFEFGTPSMRNTARSTLNLHQVFLVMCVGVYITWEWKHDREIIDWVLNEKVVLMSMADVALLSETDKKVIFWYFHVLVVI